MFIRSSTAINDCLISVKEIATIKKGGNLFVYGGSEKYKQEVYIIDINNSFHKELYKYFYKSEKDRDKAFDELCAFLNTNYKLKDFT